MMGDDRGDDVIRFPDRKRRPVIRVVPGQLPETVDEAESALLDAGAPIYVRGGLLVTPGYQEVPASNGRSFRSPRLLAIGVDWLVEQLTAVAQFQRYDRRSSEWRAINCPRPIAQTLLSRGAWRFDLLGGVQNAPTTRADGSLLQGLGYDPGSHLIFDFERSDFPIIGEAPKWADAQTALSVLSEAFRTFPFVDDTDLSVVLSGLLTLLVRRSIPTAPLHAITAHAPGSGKSLLVDVIATIATARVCPVTAIGRNAEELEKRLGAMLLCGDPIISLDNIDRPLESDFLCQALTQEIVRIRILGRSERIETPSNAAMFATGNNLRLAGDLSRRCLVARLDPRCERPELRTFERDAIAYACAHRSRIVHAAMTIIAAYAVAGRPAPTASLGSFSVWSSLVRDALIWAGGADPVDSLELVREGDPEREVLRTVMCAWMSCIGLRPITVAEVLIEAQESSDLRLALSSVAADRAGLSPGRLGAWLSRFTGRRVDGMCFENMGSKQHAVVWRLVGHVS